MIRMPSSEGVFARLLVDQWIPSTAGANILHRIVVVRKFVEKYRKSLSGLDFFTSCRTTLTEQILGQCRAIFASGEPRWLTTIALQIALSVEAS